MRVRTEWKPSYRCKCIDGPPSGWDTDWFYHLPFPLMSVEWLDVSVAQQTAHVPPRIIDHSAWIEELLTRIGLDFQKGTQMIRIFGYSPKSLDLFDRDIVH